MPRNGPVSGTVRSELTTNQSSERSKSAQVVPVWSSQGVTRFEHRGISNSSAAIWRKFNESLQ